MEEDWLALLKQAMSEEPLEAEWEEWLEWYKRCSVYAQAWLGIESAQHLVREWLEEARAEIAADYAAERSLHE